MIMTVHEMAANRQQNGQDYAEHASDEAYDIYSGRPALGFDLFRLWLDLNPYVRSMFLEALNPKMWAIDPKGKPLPEALENKGSIIEVKMM